MTDSAHASAPQTITRVVSTCAECPFFDADGDYCREMGKDTDRRSLPDWCPLRKGSVLIVLSEAT